MPLPSSRGYSVALSSPRLAPGGSFGGGLALGAAVAIAVWACGPSGAGDAGAVVSPSVDSGCAPSPAAACGYPSQGTSCPPAASDPNAYGACARPPVADAGADGTSVEADAGADSYCCLNWSSGACTPDVQAGCAAGEYGFACASGHGPAEEDPQWTCAPGAKAGTVCCSYPTCAPDPSVSCATSLAGNTGWRCPYGGSAPSGSGSLTLCSDGEPSADGKSVTYCCLPLAPAGSTAQSGCSAGGRGVCSAVSNDVYGVACSDQELPSSLGFTETACSLDAGMGSNPDYVYYCCTATL